MSATRKAQILHSLTFLLIFGLLPAVTSTMLAGGQTEEKDATEEVQHIVDQVKAAYVDKTNGTPSEFTVVKYRSQVVAGTNYFVKVRTGDDTYAHLRIFVPLPYAGNTPELVEIQTGKTKDETIGYF